MGTGKLTGDQASPGTDWETVDCPRLRARLTLSSCVEFYHRRPDCRDCPIGERRERSRGVVPDLAREPVRETRKCANPSCSSRIVVATGKSRNQRPVRYCTRECMLAVDRVRARVCHLRKRGRLQEASDLQLWLDDRITEAGWSVTHQRIVLGKRLPKKREVLSGCVVRLDGVAVSVFGEPLGGPGLWTADQVWQGLGLSSREELEALRDDARMRGLVGKADVRELEGEWLYPEPTVWKLGLLLGAVSAGDALALAASRVCLEVDLLKRQFREVGLDKQPGE